MAVPQTDGLWEDAVIAVEVVAYSKDWPTQFDRVRNRC
jgi:hypothetical protein